MLTPSTGTPDKQGLYVAYTNGLYPTLAERIFLMWYAGQWSYPSSDQSYRGEVYGWVGPLDVMRLQNVTC